MENMIWVVVSMFLVLAISVIVLVFVVGAMGGPSGGANPGSIASDILGGI